MKISGTIYITVAMPFFSRKPNLTNPCPTRLERISCEPNLISIISTCG